MKEQRRAGVYGTDSGVTIVVPDPMHRTHARRYAHKNCAWHSRAVASAPVIRCILSMLKPNVHPSRTHQAKCVVNKRHVYIFRWLIPAACWSKWTKSRINKMNEYRDKPCIMRKHKNRHALVPVHFFCPTPLLPIIRHKSDCSKQNERVISSKREILKKTSRSQAGRWLSWTNYFSSSCTLERSPPTLLNAPANCCYYRRARRSEGRNINAFSLNSLTSSCSKRIFTFSFTFSPRWGACTMVQLGTSSNYASDLWIMSSAWLEKMLSHDVITRDLWTFWRTKRFLSVDFCLLFTFRCF